MSERTDMSAMHSMDRLSRRETIDSVPETLAYAESLWEAFVRTHPMYGEYKTVAGVEFLTDYISIEDAFECRDIVKYEGAEVELHKVAELIVRRARQASELAAASAYNTWAQSKIGQVAMGVKPAVSAEQKPQKNQLELAA